MSGTALGVSAAVLGFGGGVVAIVSRYLPHRRPAPASTPAFATFTETLPPEAEAGEYRHCPACDRDRYSAVHADGSAHCWTCKTEIPAPAL
ncbi:hypothetical protein [Streptomyces sp. RKAG337]|uniref:hypothetical protein n=1 Tax=Streptomyces sp. RKAG337 TaxID=2893404 RepID=UPI00203465D6|nr:hypothetical protein [Streptomyces sp. RKAG337]MCM2427357.1 hypothetical protein [Streptomyces sp. RKAG337]